MNINILIRFILGGIIFLYSFNIIATNHNFEIRKTYFKVISILLIGSALYSMITMDINNNWTQKDKKILKNACVMSKDSINVQYPKLYEEYCDCAIEKIMQNMTKDEVRKSKIEKLDAEVQFAKTCLIELFLKINKSKK